MNNKIIFPDYEHSVLNLINSILKYYNVKTNYNGLNCLSSYLKKDYKNVAFLILDGMGRNLLKSIDTNGFFWKNKIDDITSLCPSTTTAVLNTFYSGKPPIETGWIAWSQYFKELGRNLDMFPRTDSYTGESYSKTSRIDVFDLVSYKTVYDQIKESSEDVKVYDISPSHCDSRAPKSIKANSIYDICSTIEALCSNKDKNFILAYTDHPDTILHKFGCSSTQVKDFVLEAQKEIEAMSKNLENSDTLLIISADHGHNDIDKCYSSINLGDLNELFIMPPSLESRAVTFWIKDGYKEEFANKFNNKFKNEFLLFTKKEFLEEKHLLGFGTPHKKIDDFIGDFVAVSISGSIIKLETNLSKPKSDKLSTHCGFTENEMIVPCIVKDLSK